VSARQNGDCGLFEEQSLARTGECLRECIDNQSVLRVVQVFWMLLEVLEDDPLQLPRHHVC
jgi:hypothetical protein